MCKRLFLCVSLVFVIGRQMELLTLYRDSRDKGSLLTVWVDEPPEFIVALLIDDVTIT
jgi:hypothetical protein